MDIEYVVTHNEGFGILLLEGAEELEQGSLLGTCACVLGIAGGVESSFVTDAKGVGVVTGAVGANLGFGAARLDGAVAEDDVVIADAVPASGAMPVVDLDGGGGLVRTNGTAMDDDEGDGEHDCEEVTHRVVRHLHRRIRYRCRSRTDCQSQCLSQSRCLSHYQCLSYYRCQSLQCFRYR